MNENIKSASPINVVDQAKIDTQNLLTEFTYSKDFLADINTAFGENIDFLSLEQFYQQWQEENFSNFPEIKLTSSVDINGANGAYSIDTNRMYLAQEFLVGNDTEAISNLLLEEYGHYIDARINRSDTPGDEGAIFAALVSGKTLSATELDSLKQEDDSTNWTLGKK